MREFKELKEFAYICPVETRGAALRALHYIRAHSVAADIVVFICLKSDVAFLLRQRFPEYRWLALEDIPSAWDAARKAGIEVSASEARFLEYAKRSVFLHSVLNYVHAEFFLHLMTCARVVEALFTLTTEQQRWIITPTSVLWSYSFVLFGDRNPLFAVVLRAALERRKQPYMMCGSSFLTNPTTLKVIEVLRIAANVILLMYGVLLSIFIGVLRGVLRFLRHLFKEARVQGSILVFSREAFSIAPLTALEQTAQREGRQLYYADFENFRFPFNAAGFIALAAKCFRIIFPVRGRFSLGRLDTRLPAASWLVFMVQASSITALVQFIRHIVHLPKELAYTQRSIKLLCGEFLNSRTTGDLQGYVKTFVAGLAVEYLFSWLAVESLIDATRPSVIVRPDGYSTLVRLLQWRSQQSRLRDIQVPHGYPNRTFPSYWYRASCFAVPTVLTERHLGRYTSVPRSAMVRVVREEAHPTDAILPRQLSSSGVRNLALVYTGTYAYWSFPNFFKEHWTLSCELIQGLLVTFPRARIVLKTHPNGTSPEFFQALLAQFPSLVRHGMLVHVSEGWSRREQFASFDLAFSFLTFPSSPLVHFALAGMPLLIIDGRKTPEHRLYYPTVANIFDFPWLLDTAKDAVIAAQRILSSNERWQVARAAMRQYGALLRRENERDAVPFSEFVVRQAQQ